MGCTGLQAACMGLQRGCMGLQRGCMGLQRGCMGLQRGCMGLQRGCEVAAGVHERGEQLRVRRGGGVAEEGGQQRARVEEEGAVARGLELRLPLTQRAQPRLQLAHLGRCREM